MSTHNICFHAEVRKYQYFWIEKSALTSAMIRTCKKFCYSQRYKVARLFVCVEDLQPSQPIRVMSSAVSLPIHTFSWAGLVL